jgi:dipeptidyl aminopeptidase/acylaminoacyl peptidase
MVSAAMVMVAAVVAGGPWERPVQIPVTGGERLSATLTTPDGGGPHPLAVIIGGFGPQGRDGGDDLYRRLAADLAARGVAALRYDKRGIGESPGPPLAWLNGELLAADAQAAARAGAALPEADAGRVVLVGHSQGGVLSLRAGRRAPVAGVVTLAAPGRPLGELPRVGGAVPLWVNAIAGRVGGRATLARDPRADARALRTPLVIIHGDRDGVVAPENLRDLAGARRDGRHPTRAVVLRGVGHQFRSGADEPLPEQLVDTVAAFATRPERP